MTARLTNFEHRREPLHNLVALNASSAKTLSCGGFNTLILYVNHVVNTSATAIKFVFAFQHPSDTSTYHSLTAVSVAAGTGTRTDYVDSYTVAAADSYIIQIAVPPGAPMCRVTSSSTAGAATDTVTTYVTLANLEA